MGDCKRTRTGSESSVHPSVNVACHPVIQHKITQLRRAETSNKHFRELTAEVTLYLGFEATQDLELNTDPSNGSSNCLKSQVALIPIMRGGLGLVDSMLNIVPVAQVHHIGMYNNPESLLPVLYYNKLPTKCQADVIIILDVQIGSGATLIATLDIIKEWCRDVSQVKIKVVSLIASKFGLARLAQAHPEVQVYVAAVDDSKDNGAPLPGFGDPGNRMFNAF